ncbi:hypothetical protein GCM10023331_26770 [Algivirga pacifica]|uniref:Uncharacterized protein n=1 Tax=Algivirga pacifica TaxID=1162670 RepID=A0ABP9DGV0_9BACT
MVVTQHLLFEMKQILINNDHANKSIVDTISTINYDEDVKYKDEPVFFSHKP